MLLTDKEILEKGGEIITPFAAEHVKNICYDLETEYFCLDHAQTTEYELDPGCCVFVQAKEEIRLPEDMYAQVVLRNSRIRQGLDLSAPIYQPGHKTKVFFRVMNVSKSRIHLTTGRDMASLMLYRLDNKVDTPYGGAFQGEFDFKGLGDYKSSLGDDIQDIEQKVKSVRSIEKSIYGNVLAIMAVFVAIFSLINVNVSLVANAMSMRTLLTLNFATVGSITFLLGIVESCLLEKKRSEGIAWKCGTALYLAAMLVQLLPIW